MRLIFLFIPFICFSQHSVFKDSLEFIDLNNYQSELKPIKSQELKLIKVSGISYLIDKFGGNIFILENKRLKKIDNSYRHRVQINSNIFSYNDTIFRHGGYGFWETRDLLIFYDFKTNEWEIKKNKNKGIKKYSHLITIKNNKLITFGGFLKDDSLNSFETKSNSVYSYDFQKNEWTNLGDSKYHFSKDDNIIDIGDDKKVIIRKDIKDTIFLIKPFENKIEFYKSNNFSKNIVSNKNLKSFYKDSVFHLISNIHVKNKLEINKRFYDEFLSNKFGENSFVSKKNNYIIEILVILFLIVFILIYFKKPQTKKNRKTLILNNKSVNYKKRKIEISDYDMSIISLLKKNNEFKIIDLMSIYKNSELNYNHQLRIMNKIINDLNNKIKTLMDLKKPFIIVAKSDLDKRIRVYKLNNQVTIK